jgi:hypothetical protein
MIEITDISQEAYKDRIRHLDALLARLSAGSPDHLLPVVSAMRRELVALASIRIAEDACISVPNEHHWRMGWALDLLYERPAGSETKAAVATKNFGGGG